MRLPGNSCLQVGLILESSKKKSIKKLTQEYFGKLSGLYIENSNLPD